MRIVVDPRGEARLDERDDFRSFSLLMECAPDQLDEAISRWGRLEGDGHAWVSRSWLIENGRSNDPSWIEQFEKMSAYAANSGWVDASGAIRAHVVMGG